MPWLVNFWWSNLIRYFVPKTASSAFSAATPVVSLSPAFERILQSFYVWIPSSSMLSRSSCARKRSSQILKMSYPTVSWRVVPANFTTILSTSARETFCGVTTSQADVEDESERAGYEDLVLIQLRHRNIQDLAWSGLASIKGYALNRALGLHRSEYFSACAGFKVSCTAIVYS